MKHAEKRTGTKHGVKITTIPDDPKALYMRNLYHTFFWGPFYSEDEVSKAIKTLDKADSYWDYDPFCVIYGADPLPDDFVFGFKFVEDETKARIKAKVKELA